MTGSAVALALAAAACVPQSTSYPIEIFAEMHYSQAHKSQEPPRLPPPAQAVVFEQLGGPQVAGADLVLDIPERRHRPYEPARAGELYRVNCSVCHGAAGRGDGPAAQHLTNTKSYWASETGGPYAKPSDLQLTRSNSTRDAVFAIISNGIVVMPRWELLLSEEERWDLAEYIFDEQTGLGTPPR